MSSKMLTSKKVIQHEEALGPKNKTGTGDISKHHDLNSFAFYSLDNLIKLFTSVKKVFLLQATQHFPIFSIHRSMSEHEFLDLWKMSKKSRAAC